jgi:hypothetical protein
MINSIRGLWAQVKYPLGFTKNGLKADSSCILFGAGNVGSGVNVGGLETTTLVNGDFLKFYLESLAASGTNCGISLNVTKGAGASMVALEIVCAGGATAMAVTGNMAITGDVVVTGALTATGGLSPSVDATLHSLTMNGTLSSVGLSMPVGTVATAIRLGAKASVDGSGLALNANNSDGSSIAYLVGVFGDLNSIVPANGVDLHAVESRFLVADDCSASGCTLNALRGHLRVASGKLSTGTCAGLIGYIEIDGTSVIGTNENAAVLGMVDVSGTVSGAANSILSAFCAASNGLTLGTARSTVLHIPSAASFGSLIDCPAAGLIASGGSTGITSWSACGAWYRIKVVIGNSTFYIPAATTITGS